MKIGAKMATQQDENRKTPKMDEQLRKKKVFNIEIKNIKKVQKQIRSYQKSDWAVGVVQ